MHITTRQSTPIPRSTRLKARLAASTASVSLTDELVARRSALVFDPLEPRVLLNADVLAVQLAVSAHHAVGPDLLIQAITESTQVGQASQAVQRVEVVDRAGNDAVLAIGDLSAIRSVAIAGGTSSDHVTINLDSFGASSAPVISYKGGTGASTLTLQGGSASNSAVIWQVDGSGAGTATGPNGLSVSFSGVGAIAGTGSDTLDGPATDTQWQVTGDGVGTVGAVAFAGMAHLQGAADNQDIFNFGTNGRIAGGVDGGAGGFDTVVLASAASVGISASDAASGTVSLDGRVTAYAGMEPIVVSGTATDLTLDLQASAATATRRPDLRPRQRHGLCRACARRQRFPAPKRDHGGNDRGRPRLGVGSAELHRRQ